MCVRVCVCVCERQRGLLPLLSSFLLPIIPRRISREVHRKEVAETCWGTAHPRPTFLKRSRHMHGKTDPIPSGRAGSSAARRRSDARRENVEHQHHPDRKLVHIQKRERLHESFF